MEDRYHFERFSSDINNFDNGFEDFVNAKYREGWKYKDCQFHLEGDNGHAYCIFKRS